MSTHTSQWMMIAAILLATETAGATTFATFADPTIDGSTPMFTYTSSTNVLTGGWSGSNLTLQAPAQIPSAASYPNAHFTMTPITVVGTVGPVLVMSPGQVNFFDSAMNPPLTITFSGGFLQPTTNFGASDFIGFNLAFSGPVLNGYPFLENEAFAFSFANLVNTPPTGTPTGYTVTSSFTSSADFPLHPSPGTAASFALGGLVAARRRR